MITIEHPFDDLPELSYVLDVILSEFLDIDYKIQPSTQKNIISLKYAQKTINIKAPVFTRLAETGKITPPERPLPVLDSADFPIFKDITLTAPTLPIIFGTTGLKVSGQNTIDLDLDLFGSCFYMLSRYEELGDTICDIHDRFPATASLAFQEGFLERPIVDEYVEILWQLIHHLWPEIARKERRFKMNVTADVDHIYAPVKNLKQSCKMLGSAVLRYKNSKLALKIAPNYILARQGNYKFDPYCPVLRWMMTQNEAIGNRMTFYFEAGLSTHPRDGYYRHEEEITQNILKQVLERGHRVGLHPSYNTYRDPALLQQEVRHVSSWVKKNEGFTMQMEARQHYLRWKTAETMRHYEAAGLECDSTLGFADHSGFRCGTCHEYPLFDAEQRTPLKLRERPVIMMEGTVIGDMALGPTSQALTKMKQLKETCRLFEGTFTMIWHNSEFRFPESKNMYQEIIQH